MRYGQCESYTFLSGILQWEGGCRPSYMTRPLGGLVDQEDLCRNHLRRQMELVHSCLENMVKLIVNILNRLSLRKNEMGNRWHRQAILINNKQTTRKGRKEAMQTRNMVGEKQQEVHM